MRRVIADDWSIQSTFRTTYPTHSSTVGLNMQPNVVQASFLNPFALWVDLALKTTQMLWAPTEVTSPREGPILLSPAHPSLRNRSDADLTGRDKIEAGTKSIRPIGASIAEWQIQLGALALNHMIATAKTFASLAASRNLDVAPDDKSSLGLDAVAAPTFVASKSASSATQPSDRTVKPSHSEVKKKAKRVGKRGR